jgi:hypothetical protein
MRDSAWVRAVAVAAQIGFSIACPMVVFIGGGAWLDSRLGWSPWLLLLGVVLGVVTAGGLFYQLATAIPGNKSTGADESGEARRLGRAPYKLERDRRKLRDAGTPRAEDKTKRNGR